MTSEATRWLGRHQGKDALREKVWAALYEAGAVDHDPRGSIPDFDGADRAAELLAQQDFWRDAAVVKCTPDACQAPIRLRALQDGKLLYMAYPQLKVYPCFIELEAEALAARGVSLEEASTMDGAIAHGRPVPFEEMKRIDLVNVGSVAVTIAGGRTGKGAGFADLELALLRDAGAVVSGTVIASTVHPLSIVPDEELPMTPTDSTIDWVVTEEAAYRTTSPRVEVRGIDWQLVQPDQLATIPILAQLAAARESAD